MDRGSNHGKISSFMQCIPMFQCRHVFFFPAKSVNTKSGASTDSYEQSAFSICELAEMRVTVFRHI